MHLVGPTPRATPDARAVCNQPMQTLGGAQAHSDTHSGTRAHKCKSTTTTYATAVNTRSGTRGHRCKSTTATQATAVDTRAGHHNRRGDWPALHYCLHNARARCAARTPHCATWKCATECPGHAHNTHHWAQHSPLGRGLQPWACMSRASLGPLRHARRPCRRHAWRICVRQKTRALEWDSEWGCMPS